MQKLVVLILCALFISGCASVKLTSEQQTVLDDLQSQAQVLIQENETIQKWTAMYDENMRKIEEIQQQIQFYQDQRAKAQEQLQAAQDKAQDIQDSAIEYKEQWRWLLHKLWEKLQDL